MRLNSYGIYIAALVFSPLAFGAVEPWSLAVMECLMLLALALFLHREAARGDRPLRAVPGLTPLFCIAAWCLLQLIPLPAGIVGGIAPATFRAYASGAALADMVSWMPLSLAPRETAAELLRLAAYIACYFLTVQFLSRSDRFRKTLGIVLPVAAGISLFGMLQYVTYNGKIYWLRSVLPGSIPFGPFVNRNHFSGFMGMLFPLALAVFLSSQPTLLPAGFRERFLRFFSRQKAPVHILSGLAAVSIATAVFLSLSRGGILSLCLSLIVFGMFLIGRRSERRRGVMVVAVCLAIVTAVGWFGWGPILDRFERMRDARGDLVDLRRDIWQDTVRIVPDFPLLGAGFGSFQAVYPAYGSLEGGLIVDHAHNDYLELLVEGGIVSCVFALWFLGSVLLASYRAYRIRRDQTSKYLFAGSVAGVCALLIHGLIDFNMHIGANGLYFFFLAGVAVSSAHTRFRESAEPSLLAALRPAVSRRLRSVSAAAAAVALLFSASTLLAGYFYATIGGIRLQRLKEPKDIAVVQGMAQRAVLFDPLEPRYRLAEADAAVMLHDAAAARRSLLAAVRLSPTNGTYLQRLGLVESALQEGARAEELLRAGIAFDGRNPLAHKRYGLWLLERGERKKGLDALSAAVALEPGQTREYIATLVLYGLSEDEIAAALPLRVAPRLVYADYLHQTGRDDGARRAYLDALGCVGNESRPSREWFSRAGVWLLSRGFNDDVPAVAQQAARYFPDDAHFPLLAAAAYEKAGMASRATEEYRRALILDPGNETARQRLDAAR